MGGSSVEPKDIKAFRPKPLWTIKERRRLASSPVQSPVRKHNTKEAKEFIDMVREANPQGRCATNSLILYSLLERRREKPRMMGVWTSRQTYLQMPLLPSHFFVATRKHGILNSFPEGFYEQSKWKHHFVMPVDMRLFEYRMRDLVHFVEKIEAWICLDE
jgi:hypothetical protein